jgi:3-phenylpropionate/cinnamic acid dioxygenase small subunit
VSTDLALRFEIDALYARYAQLLDEGPLAEWPSLFSEDALYKATSRENVERGWPLALMLCESRGALEDRANAIENLSLTIPRRMRHMISGIIVSADGANCWKVDANFAVFETIVGQQTVTFAAGRYRDTIARAPDGVLRFKEKLAICDAALIRNSLVYPL